MSKVSDVLSVAHVIVGIGATILIRGSVKKLTRRQMYTGICMSLLAMGVSTYQTKDIINAVKKECKEVENVVHDMTSRNG